MFQDMFHDPNEPTEADVGRFIPSSQLLSWHAVQKQRYPQVYPPDDKLFGDREKQYSFGSKLLTYFDDDVNKPMRCEVVGSKWNGEYGIKEPMYVVMMNNELSLIPLTSGHEEGGWKFVGGGIDSDKGEDYSEEEDYDEEDYEEEDSQEPMPAERNTIEANQTRNDSTSKCAYPPCGEASPGKKCSRCKVVAYCSQNCQKSHWKYHKYCCVDSNVPRHIVPSSASLESIQNAIDRAQVNDVIEIEDGVFEGETLEINKNLHFVGKGYRKDGGTVLKCTVIVKQNGCSGGKFTMRDLLVEGSLTVEQNTYENIEFVSVEVNCNNQQVDAISINECNGKLLLYCCEVTGGRDGLSIMSHSTRAKLDQTDISFAACRGIFANPNFEITGSAVYNCGGYGIKCRGGYTDLGGNEIQPGPWSSSGYGF